METMRAISAVMNRVLLEAGSRTSPIHLCRTGWCHSILRNQYLTGKDQLHPFKSKWTTSFDISAFSRAYTTHTTVSESTKNLKQTESSKRKAAGKKEEVVSILLMSETENVSQTTLADAEKLAKRRGFRLVEVVPVEVKFHTDKKVYKLEKLGEHADHEWKKAGNDGDSESESEHHRKERPQRVREDKTILLSGKISEHDCEGKIKQMNKLLAKGYKLRVFVGGSGSAGGDPDFVFQKIQKELSTSAKIQQKQRTPNEIRFQVVPITPEENEASDSNSKKNAKGDKPNNDKRSS